MEETVHVLIWQGASLNLPRFEKGGPILGKSRY